MNEISKVNDDCEEVEIVNNENNIVELTDELLVDARTSIDKDNALSVPIAELATLGAGVASLMPAFNTVTQTATIAADGLFRVANAGPGDVIKWAKDGNAWGALKTAAGKSKMAKFAKVDPVSVTTKTVKAIDPTTMMMAVALYSIERQLSEIKEIQKEILSFLEIENESQIEADVESLMKIISTYKYDWDNKLSVESNHQLVTDMQNRARKNMIAYQKKVNKIVNSKKLLISQKKINSSFSDLQKKFKYYRLSLYTYSLASLLEIMLSGNFKEEYIENIKEEIKSLSMDYREQFNKASIYLEKLGQKGVEANLIKGIGTAGKSVGKFIKKIPIVEKGPVDEFLEDKGLRLRSHSAKMKSKDVKAFAAIGNPETSVFINKMEDMIQIYNYTNQICFDKEKIYLLK